LLYGSNILPWSDRARTAPEQSTTHGRPTSLSATGINRRTRSRSGIPAVIQHALPHYRALLTQGRDPELALLDTLLLLMSINGDTNVASCGGAEGLRWLQQQATALIQQGGFALPISNTYTSSTNSALNATSVPEAAPIADRHRFLAQISQVHHYHN
jgi:triphosphoribosyl-dephospho-CoA synthase